MAIDFSKKTVAELDAMGLFPAAGETDEAFSARLEKLSRELEAIQNRQSDLEDLIQQSRPLSPEVRAAADRLTWEKYRFRADWVPGWYSSRQTGFFSAGILLEIDGWLPLVFLHGKFAVRKRRIGYNDAETLAHELVHAVRTVFPFSVYGEYFPCQVHASAFRRQVGNIFRRWYWPFLLFGGIAAVPVLAAAESIFWFIPLAGPLLVVARELWIRKRLRKAADNLRRAGMEPLPVLLRLSDQEISEVALLTPDMLAVKKNSSSRWKHFTEDFRLVKKD